MVGQLVGVPAEAHTEAHPTAGQMIECGDGLRQSDRVVFDGNRHRGCQANREVTAHAVAGLTHGSRVRM